MRHLSTDNVRTLAVVGKWLASRVRNERLNRPIERHQRVVRAEKTLQMNKGRFTLVDLRKSDA
jgi:hypothetical protein